ncbi:MAG: hypothetical protein IKP47_03490 [Ruminococcus sp.]|nr:hypothetical protein [Ruminococcus sp.]
MIILAVILIAGIAACITAEILRRRTPGTAAGYILIPCCDDTEDIEQLVKNAYWSERLERRETRRRILIVLISAREKGYTAKRLAAELDNVEAVDITALCDRILRDRKQRKEKNE